MNTVFSFIVQKRLSQENENVATEALGYILDANEHGRSGLVKLLRGVAPDLPETLRFRTQETEDGARPDMWGWDGDTPRVFIEFKFWAGLTDQQPVKYLDLLAGYPSPTLLLVVVPAERLESVWMELARRLAAANLKATALSPSGNVPHVVATEAGPVLAITSWAKVLTAIEGELDDERGDDTRAKNDLLQLRALCEAADLDAGKPFASADLTNQNTPAFMLQLSAIVQLAVTRGVAEGVLNIRGSLPMANWERAGRYIRFGGTNNVGAWFGTDFRRWRERGSTPLWLVFNATEWGRANEAREAMEPWAAQHSLPCGVSTDGAFGLGIDVVPGQEQDVVVMSIVKRLAEVGAELGRLPPRLEKTS